MTTAVELTSVTHAVADRVPLHDVSLVVPAGQRVALIGASGAGKTTLLRLVAALAQPTRGSVRTLGAATAGLHGRRLRELRRRVGFLHQHDNLVPQLRVAHNVLIGRLGRWSLWRSLWSLLRPRELDAVHAALERVELADRLWAMPDELSGGEQQRVAIARLLLQDPELVLADEPVSSLDQRLGREVVRRLFELVEPQSGSGRRTLLVSLHSLALLDSGFDRVVALRDGEVVADDVPAAFDRERLQLVYGAGFDALDVAPS